MPIAPANCYAAVHASLSGPGDGRPTAAQIITDNDLTGKLSSKTILVTGGSGGLGVDVVRQLAKTCARVFFTSRDMGKGEGVKTMLEREAQDEGREARIEVLEMEMASLASVRRAAEEFKGRSEGLNVLVNNAGLSNLFPLKLLRREGRELKIMVRRHRPRPARPHTRRVRDALRSQSPRALPAFRAPRALAVEFKLVGVPEPGRQRIKLRPYVWNVPGWRLQFGECGRRVLAL